MSSLHRDALGQVARSVHVDAAHIGDVVAEQLQRHHGEQRVQALRRRRQQRHLEHKLGAGVEVGVPFVGDDDDGALARDDLLDVALDLIPVIDSMWMMGAWIHTQYIKKQQSNARTHTCTHTNMGWMDGWMDGGGVAPWGKMSPASAR